MGENDLQKSVMILSGVYGSSPACRRRNREDLSGGSTDLAVNLPEIPPGALRAPPALLLSPRLVRECGVPDVPEQPFKSNLIVKDAAE